VRDAEWQRHIRDTLGRWCIIRWIHNSAELDGNANLTSATIVLWHLEPSIEVTAGMMATLRRIRSSVSEPIVILYCRVAPEIARLLLVAGRLGVDRVALRGYDDLASVVADALHERRYGAAIEHIMTELELRQHSASPLLAQAIRQAFDGPFGVERLAGTFGISRKTLNNRLRTAGLPSPAVVISWSRLFAAGWLLDEPTQTVASVGRSLRFTSSSELRGMLARYVHARPTELRQRGALRAILAAFRAATTEEPPQFPRTDQTSQSRTRQPIRSAQN